MTAALTEVTVNVTQAHLADGVRCSCSHCPIARAMADALPEAVAVWVGGVRAEIEMEWGAPPVEVILPGEVEEFIGRFDDDGFGEPFTFTVSIPAEVLS